ncbi:MAG: hypothetical protein K6347_08265, partial [Campylobacterales bacterium]
MWVSLRSVGVASLLLFLLTGCSYKIAEKGGVQAHKVVQLEPTKFMPTLEQMRAEKSKVVIFPIDEKAPLAKKAGAGSV